MRGQVAGWMDRQWWMKTELEEEAVRGGGSEDQERMRRTQTQLMAQVSTGAEVQKSGEGGQLEAAIRKPLLEKMQEQAARFSQQQRGDGISSERGAKDVGKNGEPMHIVAGGPTL